MKTSFTSNLGVQNAMRLTIQQNQSELVRAQKEVSTGTYADIGVSLGSSTGKTVEYNQDINRMKGLLDTNAVVTQRLSASQEALSKVSENVQGGLESLIALSGSSDANQLAIAKREMTNALNSFTSSVNTSVNGEYLFAGINTDEQPLNDYFDPAGSAAKTSFDTAFQTEFGFAKDDPQASNITSTQMSDFLTNVVEPMFTGSQWNTDWSTASDENMKSQISKFDTVETSTNLNTEGFRKFAMAAVVSIELMDTPINPEARQVVSEKTIGYAGEASAQIDIVRGQLGLSESRVKQANTSMQSQIKIVETSLNDLQGVDAYEASTRVNALLSQVETSYTLTAKIQKLSLVNYL